MFSGKNGAIDVGAVFQKRKMRGFGQGISTKVRSRPVAEIFSNRFDQRLESERDASAVVIKFHVAGEESIVVRGIAGVIGSPKFRVTRENELLHRVALRGIRR